MEELDAKDFVLRNSIQNLSVVRFDTDDCRSRGFYKNDIQNLEAGRSSISAIPHLRGTISARISALKIWNLIEEKIFPASRYTISATLEF